MKREVEIKCLLSGEAERDELVAKVSKLYPASKQVKSNVVIISYFYKPVQSAKQLLDVAKELVKPADLDTLRSLIDNSSDLSVKARSVDGEVFFTVKGAAKGEDAVHAVSRIEFEVVIESSLEELGDKLVAAGIELASKWSSKRDFYELEEDQSLQVEFVAGYGYKAELEIVTEADEPEEAMETIRKTARDLGLVEADQKLFGRMYEYYNAHWQEYFGTTKVFDDTVWHELGRSL